MTLRAVLDTNVIVSRHLTPGGVPGRIMDLLELDAFLLMSADALLAECNRVLHYDRTRRIHRMSHVEIEKLILGLRDLAELVSITGDVDVIAAGPSDNMVLECAVAGNADVIVTGDKKHLLPLGSYQGIPIVSPADFLAMLDDTHRV